MPRICQNFNCGNKITNRDVFFRINEVRITESSKGVSITNTKLIANFCSRECLKEALK